MKWGVREREKSRSIKCGVKVCGVTDKTRGDFGGVFRNKLLIRTVYKIDSC